MTIVFIVMYKEMMLQNVIVLMDYMNFISVKLIYMNVEPVVIDVLDVMLTNTIVNSVSNLESKNQFVIVHQVCTKLPT